MLIKHEAIKQEQRNNKVEIYGEGIRERLPEKYADKPIRCFYGYYRDGLKVKLEGERGGPDTLAYEANDEEDLRLWQFEQACCFLSYEEELRRRKENSKKWRFLRDTVKKGNWLYVERRVYLYNAIEDTRLAWFEEYLRLIKPVLPPKRWERRVQKCVTNMNRWYKIPHWDFDRNALCFVEISDSKSYAGDSDDTEEPRPGSVIRIID